MSSQYRRSTAMVILSLILLIDCHGVTAQKRIVGGNQAAQGEFPFFVDTMGGCGASLIAPGIVLTAAHCSDYDSYINRFVSVGAYQQGGGAATGAKKSKVIDAISHPKYDSIGINYDFALLRLADKVTLPTTSNIVFKINKDEALPAIGQNLTVVGLGMMGEDDDDMPTILQEVQVHAIDHKVCNQDYDGQVLEESMFCAGVEGGGKDSCQGDSGGPLFIRNGNEHIQVGIVSWGEGCARSGFPGVYARISHAYDWIRQVACGCWESSASTTLCEGYVDTGKDCPTAPPVFVPDPNCDDFADYEDEFGDSCEWYEINDEPGCSVYGDISGGTGFEGINPMKACCFCGGGGDRIPTISPAPTKAPVPTNSPTKFTIDPDCNDYEGFVDAYGDDCVWYSDFDDPGCPIEGETTGGDGFEGITASEACCTCGGGGERGPTAAPGPTTAPTPEATHYGPNCTDFQDWEDTYGDGCDWYRENDKGGCPTHGNEEGGSGFTGISASEACCYCGGGSEDGSTFTKSPTPSPTKFEIDPNCQDVPGFYDFCGDGCWWYEEQDSPGCPEWGELIGTIDGDYVETKLGINEMEANQACCYCGGGISTPSVPEDDPTSSPSPEPTDEPTQTPTAYATDPSCVDMAEFEDYFGDNCKWYQVNDDPLCPLWGSHQGGIGFENVTAKTACCYCGGGYDRSGPLGNETISTGGDDGGNTDLPPSAVPPPTSAPANDGTATTIIGPKASSAGSLGLLLLPITIVLTFC
eukprot:CAMPEP_0113625050 /NCGR_PEP_ID=MMETSP0017_2-20120614/12929_1 /TAXON_ID=2856 /ORGANISM="Cylindrotheca closterium" /LENGTH=751 /DNA_ID=CAMNT_0000535131 /DNA_START=180 /DNA_END=2432 /DNA_ORIENTATION=- /assembly_acc=CAM_ASM_000147